MSRLDSDCYEQSFDDGHLRGDIEGRQSNMSKYIVEMPEGWLPAMCPDCHIQYRDCNGICGEKVCPLAKAQEVVEINCQDPKVSIRLSDMDVQYDGKPVKLYAAKEAK